MNQLPHGTEIVQCEAVEPFVLINFFTACTMRRLAFAPCDQLQPATIQPMSQASVKGEVLYLGLGTATAGSEWNCFYGMFCPHRSADMRRYGRHMGYPFFFEVGLRNGNEQFVRDFAFLWHPVVATHKILLDGNAFMRLP